MANERRLIVLDYDAVRTAFDEEFKKTKQLIKSGETHLDNLAEGFTEADRVLRTMLTVDAIIPVRCRDCKYSGMYCFGDSTDQKLAYLDIEDDGFIRCAKSVDPNDFCSYGERRRE